MRRPMVAVLLLGVAAVVATGAAGAQTTTTSSSTTSSSTTTSTVVQTTTTTFVNPCTGQPCIPTPPVATLSGSAGQVQLQFDSSSWRSPVIWPRDP